MGPGWHVTPSTHLGGGNSNIFYFHPKNWGRWTHFDDHMFQRGWFNHQLAMRYSAIKKKGAPYVALGCSFCAHLFWVKVVENGRPKVWYSWCYSAAPLHRFPGVFSWTKPSHSGGETVGLIFFTRFVFGGWNLKTRLFCYIWHKNAVEPVPSSNKLPIFFSEDLRSVEV